MAAKEEIEYEVVWNGGPLLPDRDQNPDHTWTEPVSRNRSKYTIDSTTSERRSKENSDARNTNN